MIRDRGMRLVAALVAGLLVAFLAGLLLVSGARPGAPPPDPAAPPEPRDAPAAETPPSPTPSAPAEDSQESLPEPSEDEEPGDTVVLGAAFLEDGSPFPGVLFLEMVPAEGGGWEVDLAADAPVDRSPVPHEFRLDWKEPRAEVVLLVLGRTAECIAAEGASIVGLEERGEVVRFTPGVPARMVFRRLPGAPVRLRLEAREGRDRFHWSAPSVELLDGDGQPLPRQGITIGMEEGGTFSEENAVLPVILEFPVLPRTERAEGDRRIAVLKTPFFEPVRIPAAEFADGMRVLLTPLRPAVTGLLSPPPVRGTPSGLLLAAAEGKGRAVLPAEGIPRSLDGDGTIRIFELPEGEWTLHVMRGTADGLRWGRRDFRKGPEPVDLGVVEADGYAGLRVRLLDADGVPQPRASLTVARAMEGAVGRVAVFHSMERPGLRGGNLLIQEDVLWIQPGTGDRDPEGWYEIPDLAPGTRYVVREMTRAGARAEVVTPAENGAWVELELRRGPEDDGE